MKRVVESMWSFAILIAFFSINLSADVRWGVTVESKIDVIDATVDGNDSSLDALNSKADIIDTTVNTNNSFLEIIDSKVDMIATNDSSLDVLNSKVDVIDGTVNTNNSLLDVIDTIVIGNDSSLDVLNSKVDVIDGTVNTNNSLIEVIDSKVDVIDTIVIGNDSSLDVLNSKVDVIDGTVNTNNSFLEVIDSKVDVIDTVVNLNSSSLDVVESKIDVIDYNLSVLDAAINTGYIVLTSADVVNGNISLTSSGHYMLGEAFTSDITITGGCVTLDFNDYCLTGSITISSDNVTIKDGTLLTVSDIGIKVNTDAAIAISSASDKTRISNMTIRTEDGTPPGSAKHGIAIEGNDWIVENCTIITGAGSGDSSGGFNGGNGINLLSAANNILVRNCLISTGSGSASTTDAGFGGDAIYVLDATDIEIADCTIFKTGAGGDGGTTNGDGGNGVYISASSIDISVHNCIIRNTGAAGGGGGGAGVAGKAIDDNVAAGANASIIFGNFAHNIANSIKFDLQASGIEKGFSLSNPPSSTAVSVYGNYYM